MVKAKIFWLSKGIGHQGVIGFQHHVSLKRVC